MTTFWAGTLGLGSGSKQHAGGSTGLRQATWVPTCRGRAAGLGARSHAQRASMAGAAVPGMVPAAFMAATSSLVAKRPLMRGRTSAYALRLWYRIVFSKVRRFRFSRYLRARHQGHSRLPRSALQHNHLAWDNLRRMHCVCHHSSP